MVAVSALGWRRSSGTRTRKLVCEIESLSTTACLFANGGGPQQREMLGFIVGMGVSRRARSLIS